MRTTHRESAGRDLDLFTKLLALERPWWAERVELDGVRLLKKESVAEMTRNQLSEEAMKAKNGG